ncbi:hypothetical protein CC80DRAFT_547445 [Byssothecium circinans]|uniref:Uncharacterized protein n=1 Tax=Byssothecium circinans TaxID=147558 RepID=A0A6A5TYN1_9PLEO|nr:hypothetical protein CC80DRAFT_547445 [Byssothecium circinans]
MLPLTFEGNQQGFSSFTTKVISILDSTLLFSSPTTPPVAAKALHVLFASRPGSFSGASGTGTADSPENERLAELSPSQQYAIWAVTAAVEGTVTPIPGAPDEVSPDPAAIEDLSFKTAVEAAWMVRAGHVMYGRGGVSVWHPGRFPLWRLEKKEAVKLRRKYKGSQGLFQERFGVLDCGVVDGVMRAGVGKAFDVRGD